VVSHRRPRDLGPPLTRTDPSQPAAEPTAKGAGLGRLKLKRRGAAPAPDPDGTKMVPAPKPDPSQPGFEDSKTLMKLEAVDVEIVDEDDPGITRPRGVP
jgi:hypothetical protein